MRSLYLKALEMQGFKSFPDRTVLRFENGVTAVVGPNGSGKSNIADAIRWVLGEQSTRALRGGKMEDVIFGGSGSRRRQGFAQVTLTLDNEERRFPMEEPEISVTRRYYRSGESEYYINRRPVRLRDVHDLFRDTGLGQEGYALISQGKIDEILSVKGEKRREIFEEAAGISRFRHRKEEAQRKLQHTEENLRRILDKLEELELQLAPLREQSDTARQYLLWRDELRTLEISLWMNRLEYLRETIREDKALFHQAEERLRLAKQEAQSLYERAENLGKRMNQWESRAENLRNRAARAEEEKSRCAAQIAVLEVQLQNNESNAARLRRDWEGQQQRLTQTQQRVEERETRLEEIARQEAVSRGTLEQVKKQVAQARESGAIPAAENHLTVCREKEKAAGDTVAQLLQEERGLDDRIKLLMEMERMYEGYSRAVKTVMREAKQGGLTGIYGPVAELLTVPADYAVAVETALGGAMGHLVVETEETGKAVFRYLKRVEGGRVTCLPLSTIRPSYLKESGLESQPGVLGVASQLITCQPMYEDVFANLLGRVVIVQNLDAAIFLARQYHHRFRIVTLDGQVLNPGGSMTGGSASRSGGILSRAGELEKLRAQRMILRRQSKKAQQMEETARSETALAATALAHTREEAAAQQSDWAQKLGEIQVLLAGLEAENMHTRQALEEQEQLAAQLRRDVARREEELAGFQAEKANLFQQIEIQKTNLSQVEEEKTRIQLALSGLAEEKLTLERSRSQADRAAREQNEVLLRLQRESSGLEQKTLASSLEEERILNKMWETYEVPHERALEIRVPLESESDAQKALQQLRGKLQGLGSVNLGSMEEFERVNQRFEFLSGQKADVEQAKAGMEEIIREITAQMREIFRREFSAINQAFEETFSQLFPGGSGSLELENQEDVLECEIEIRVKLPGKSLRVLSLLSGGERAFVSIALYFAMLKVRPTPFCVMDEIEAALDDANVERFAAYLREMTVRTQFIVITHRRGTMEEADMLYGVTMEEQGVSRLLRLSLAEAQATVNNVQ